MTLRFEIPGPPVPKGRPLFDGKRARTPERTRVYEEAVAWHARAQGWRFTGPIAVEIALYFGSTPLGDLDNYAKAILDGIQRGGLIEDDGQVRQLGVWFAAGTALEPRAVVSLRECERFVEAAA